MQYLAINVTAGDETPKSGTDHHYSACIRVAALSGSLAAVDVVEPGIKKI
jgi:hypothetical protein